MIMKMQHHMLTSETIIPIPSFPTLLTEVNLAAVTQSSVLWARSLLCVNLLLNQPLKILAPFISLSFSHFFLAYFALISLHLPVHLFDGRQKDVKYCSQKRKVSFSSYVLVHSVFFPPTLFPLFTSCYCARFRGVLICTVSLSLFYRLILHVNLCVGVSVSKGRQKLQ